jgi:hypothetical protein
MNFPEKVPADSHLAIFQIVLKLVYKKIYIFLKRC